MVFFTQYSLSEYDDKNSYTTQEKITFINNATDIIKIKRAAITTIELNQSHSNLLNEQAKLHRFIYVVISFFSLILIYGLFKQSKISNKAVKRD